MRNKLNNKGYMLIEIILASALAFGLAYFILDLTIKLKNKNDDLLVSTQINTDTTIVANKLMNFIKEESTKFDCNDIKIENNTISYSGKLITQLNQYGIIEKTEDICYSNDNYVKINIPISVPQMPDKNFNIDVYYEYSQRKKATCNNILEDYACNVSNLSGNKTLEYTGKCEVKDDGYGNCRIKFLTSGNLMLSSEFKVDVFLVGGGGGGADTDSINNLTAYGDDKYYYGGGGGGGGYTTTEKDITLEKNKVYEIKIGSGGAGKFNACGETGGTTSAFNISAQGGKGGCVAYEKDEHKGGGAGGSGGGGYNFSNP